MQFTGFGTEAFAFFKYVRDHPSWEAVHSLDGLLAQAGWLRSSADQVARYRHAVAADDTGGALVGIVGAVRRSGFGMEGTMLSTRPRGYPADHPRLELLRYRTLGAWRWISPAAVPGPGCADAVARTWRAARPLVAWLCEHVGTRR